MSRIAILHLEDSAIDAELIAERLRREGLDCAIERVETREGFAAALGRRCCDLIPADHSLPSFDGITALGMAREGCPDIPFIFVSAALGEEVAIDCLKQGATDYVLKQGLQRLGPAVRRALDEANERAGRRAAQEALAQRSVQLQHLAAISTRLSAAHDVESVARMVTEEARNLIGARQAATVTRAEPGRTVRFIADSQAVRQLNRADAPPDEPALDIQVRRTNRPLRLTRDELEADRDRPDAGPYGPAPLGWLAAPLVGRNGQNLGLIRLSDKNHGDFKADDEYILVQLAQMAAGAIENARLYEELRANDRRKDEFLAMLAHELRNPLAAVKNALAVLRLSRIEEHLGSAGDIVDRQFRQLSRLIDDLLDVSRITSGKIRLKRERIDVAGVVEAAVEAVRPLIVDRKQILTVSAERGTLFADADPARLEQVLANLLTNAAKYTESGGRIRLEAGRRGPELVLAVRDNGLGIPPDQLSRMFELFAQGERSIARSEGGLGIGLTIVRSLVEMHGGTVSAKSPGPGLGSEFTVRIPAAERPPVLAPAASPNGVAAAPGTRVLVVDDNADIAWGLSRLLNIFGHDVRTAHDGTQALAVAAEYTPEVVLLDIGLPGMDGYEVARRLRQCARCGGAAIIAISGYGQEEDRRRSREAGFDHHLVKPVDHDELLALLARAGPAAAGD